jgi:serine/threonine protein kinase
MRPCGRFLRHWALPGTEAFGSARHLAESGAHTLGVGTLAYMAPEVLNPAAPNAPAYGAAVDVYSWAILAHEVLLGRPPFGDMAQAQVAVAVCVHQQRPTPDPPAAPPKVLALIKAAWATAAGARPRATALASTLGGELARLASAQEGAAASISDADLCVVCLDQRRCFAHQPCGHVTCCSDCVVTVQTCPLCRQEIEGNLKVFL